MPDGKRLWRTKDGDLVLDEHPEAVSLAYGTGDALSDADAEKVRKSHTPKKAAQSTAKRSTK